jgi:hypothetical protein
VFLFSVSNISEVALSVNMKMARVRFPANRRKELIKTAAIPRVKMDGSICLG